MKSEDRCDRYADTIVIVPDEHSREYVARRLQERLPQVQSEVLWAVGMETPPGFVAPPEWVKGALKRVFKETTLISQQLEALRGPSPANAGRIVGLMQGMGAELNTSAPEAGDDSIFRQMHAAHSAWFQEKTADFNRLVESTPKPTKQLTPVQIAEFCRGTSEGAEFVVDQASAETTTMTTLAYWMWLLWPEATTAKTRPALHAWFEQMDFPKCSFKTVEKLCREIGFLTQPD
jgi:hypothetical protein